MREIHDNLKISMETVADIRASLASMTVMLTLMMEKVEKLEAEAKLLREDATKLLWTINQR